MKYSLRSLLIVAIVGPPLLAAGYFWLSDVRGRDVLFHLAVWGGFVCASLVFVWLLAKGSRFPEQ